MIIAVGGSVESSAGCRCRGSADGGRREIRRDRDVPPFTNNLKLTENGFKVVIPLIIPPLEEITREPATLGDHLRRRRIELGLYQKDVAARLDVTTPTVWNWENKGSVDLRFTPRVIEFLGYNPISQPEDLLEKLAWYKQVNGLTLEQLGVEMERDPEQLADWLSGRHKPCQRNREEIEVFLSSHSQGPDTAQRSGTAFLDASATASGSMKFLTARTMSSKSSGT